MADASSLYNSYNRIPLRFERGEGVWLVTEDGERYLDFASGIAVNALGHAHPHMVEALKSQAEKLWHTSNLYQSPGQEKLASRLVQASFADRVFFTNSGAEAMECAIKTARRYFFDKGQPERYHIITFENAFHGRTTTTVGAGGTDKYIEGFGPRAPGFVRVPFGDIEAVKAAVNDETAAILIEPIQGEGGIRPAEPAFLRALRAICDETGMLLIYDDVQGGVGRTGKLFSYEVSGVAPDIMGIAKGIGGGFPVGACLATEEAAAAMVPGTHGTTYGGNPLAMAAANAVLDVVLEDGFLENVRNVALVFRQGLESLKDRFPGQLEEVRGEGLFLGLKAKIPNAELLTAMREQKILGVLAGDNVVRILPPLTTTAEEAREGLNRIEYALENLQKAAG